MKFLTSVELILQTAFKVDKSFLRDFAELANYYRWDREDIAEMKQHIRDGGREAVRWYQLLARAHREGYRQTRQNDYQRLHRWCQQAGIEWEFRTGEADAHRAKNDV